MNVQSPDKWWRTLKSVFSARVRHCLRLLMRAVDLCASLLVRLICCWIILTASSPGRLLICRSLEICLLVLPPLLSGRERSGVFCKTWTLMVALTHWDASSFSFFPKRTDVMAPHLSVVFRRLVHLSSFLPCWRHANFTPIPKDPPSYSVANYRPISITSVLSMVLERVVSLRLGRFMECNGMLPTTQFASRKGLGT